MVERYHQGVRQGHQEHHGAQQEDHDSYYTSDSCVTVIIVTAGRYHFLLDYASFLY